MNGPVRRLFLAVFLVVVAVVSFQRFVAYRVASHAYAPHLVLRPQAAADVMFRTLDGEPRHLAAFKGKVVIVNYWGTWCLPCRAEMPTLQRLYDHYRNDPQVVFVMIANRDTAEQVRAYAGAGHLDLPFYLEDDAAIPLSTDFRQYPSTSIYAPDGKLAATHNGPADWSDATVIAFLDSLKR